jgi:hypothetical protein
MSVTGHLPAEDAQVVRENRVVRLLREDALRAVTPLERAERGETYAREEDYDPVLRAHCRL